MKFNHFCRLVGLIRHSNSRLAYHWALVGLMLLAPVMARATTVRVHSFSEMVIAADSIVQGEITAVRFYTEDYQGREVIRTKVTVRVEESLGGGIESEELELRFLGGEKNGRMLRVSGMPKFRKGERVVLFVKGNNRVVCPLVGWTSGRFSIQRDADSGVDYVTRAEGENVRTFAKISPRLHPSGEVVTQSSQGATLAEFVAAIERELEQPGGRDE